MESQRITRQKLYEMVWTQPFLALSKKYKISDVGLRKICKRMDIPFPKTGHWQRIRAGAKIAIPKLITNLDIDVTIKLELRNQEAEANSDSEFGLLQREIENDPRVSLVVPEHLSSRDPLISVARTTLTDNTYYKHRPDDLRNTYVNQLNIKASRSQVSRTLRFMSTLIKALRSRGHDIAVDRDTYAVIFKQKIQISLRETTKKVPAENSHNTYNYVPTGLLTFQIDEYKKFYWRDGKETLESQLSKIITRLELEGTRLKDEAFSRSLRHAEDSEIKEVEELFNKARRKELAAFRSLLENARVWEQTKMLRDFINSLKATAEPQSPTFQKWLSWANHKIDWFDPTTDADDPYMAGVDKLNLEPPDLSSWERDSWINRV